MSASSVDWYEWFDKSKQSLFDNETRDKWEFYLRNGLYKSVYRKWIREKLAEELSNPIIEEEEINSVKDKWLEARKIEAKDFDREPKEILENFYMNQKLFDQYCINEVLAYKWACIQWERMVPQVFLERKETYDRAQIKILYIDGKEKGLALEIYQILSEKEKTFDEIGSIFNKIKYSTKPEGNWVRKIDMKDEIRMRIEKMKLGEVSRPFKVEEKYLITQLIDTQGTSLDKAITENIIKGKLNNFLDYGVLQLTEYCLGECQ